VARLNTAPALGQPEPLDDRRPGGRLGDRELLERGRVLVADATRRVLRGHTVEHCFQDLGVRRVTAHCFLDEDPSWRLMERVGMRRELHAVRQALHRSGRWLDTVGYAILQEEWARTIAAPSCQEPRDAIGRRP